MIVPLAALHLGTRSEKFQLGVPQSLPLREQPLPYSSIAMSGVCQASRWPPSTAMVTPVTLAASAR